MKIALGFLFALTLLHPTTITGSIYDCDFFEKTNDTILKFEGPSSHQIISTDGGYSIELEEGEYNVTALHFENGELKYMTKEKILAGGENQTFDIVLFSPAFFENDEFPDLAIDLPQKKESRQDDTFLLATALLAMALLFFILIRKYGRSEKPPEPDKELGEDEMKVLRIIKENEGRMEQKQLRGILNFSESKMSLLLTELEVTGRIKRFKKGRENIIKLKKMI